jgi:hypothetical protein
MLPARAAYQASISRDAIAKARTKDPNHIT